MIKLVILDIDGVMTDGSKYYDASGKPIMKRYCDKDFTAIKRLKGSGIDVVFLSGDENINKAMAVNRNIPFYSARGKDKADFVLHFEQKYNITKNNMLYVGDDLFDISILQLVKYAFCPKDSPNIVKSVCGKNNILNVNGGSNVIAVLVDILLDRNLINDCSMSDIETLDKKEIF